MSRHYWNEYDQHAAAWLAELIEAGELPPGDVDTRSIKDVTADDLRGYDQCHFFAGIGGWSLALRLAGWPDDRPCWTGSCPCQPFSNAGQQKAQADDRHLWPDFFRLIRQCRPDIVFGEQVEGAIRHGWLDGVQADLEGEAYAVGHCVLGAHSVGAPHIRQRLYWLADAGHSRREHAAERQGREDAHGLCGGVEHAASYGRRERRAESDGRGIASGCGTGGMVQPHSAGRLKGWPTPKAARYRSAFKPAGSLGLWSDYVLIPCGDGKTRRLEPGLEPLVNGVPGRVGLLRGYGNAIVPQVAAAFIEAYMTA